MIKAYRFQVKSYTSFQNNKNSNFKSNVDDNYEVIYRTYIPSCNLEFYSENGVLYINEPLYENYLEFLNQNNVNPYNFKPENLNDNKKIFNLNEIDLEENIIQKIKELYNINLRKDIILYELKNKVY